MQTLYGVFFSRTKGLPGAVDDPPGQRRLGEAEVVKDAGSLIIAAPSPTKISNFAGGGPTLQMLTLALVPQCLCISVSRQQPL